MVKTRASCEMKRKSVEASRNPSTKKKKHPQGETLSHVLPIVNAHFLERDSGVPENVDVQVGGFSSILTQTKGSGQENYHFSIKKKKGVSFE